MRNSCRKWKVITVLLSAALALSLWQVPAKASSGKSSLTSDSIKKKENQIAQMEKEQEKLKNSLTDLQKVKKDLEKEKSNLKSYVAQLDSKLEEIEKKVLDLREQIAGKESDIVQTEAELETALETEQNQQESMVIRIKLMYEHSQNNVLEVLFSATSLGDLLNRADYMERVMQSDKQMYEELIANRQYVELCKEKLELEKEILDQTKANMEVEQGNLESLIEEKNQEITKYESDISTQAQAIKEYEQMIKDQDAEIATLEKLIKEEKKKLLEEGKSAIKYDGGAFKFPLSSYTRVSDDYGDRIHPTLKVQQFHNGVDFAAPKGTAIYAAYDGKVVAASYSNTMGNYVMIDHGNDLYTIYMHASSLNVEKGDVVVRGETIAAVGSTGRSTGNHLHFSVRKDGSYVSPWNYLSQ